MSKPVFLFIKGNLIDGMGFLISEKIAFRYSAKKNEVRIMLRKLSRQTMVIRSLKQIGCSVSRRYDEY